MIVAALIGWYFRLLRAGAGGGRVRHVPGAAAMTVLAIVGSVLAMVVAWAQTGARR